jgi:hypothetical protein
MSNTLDFEKICSADETKLRKAEILIFSKGVYPISRIEAYNLPENSVATIDNPKATFNRLTIKGLPVTFYPLLITFWGKIYENHGGNRSVKPTIPPLVPECLTSSKNPPPQNFFPTNKFRMISSLRNNSSNPTSFTIENDKMTMQIENISLNTSFGFDTNCGRETINDNLVAKIIIIYNPC